VIIEYHRPETLEDALDLLARPEPVTVPLGGGSFLNKPSPEPLAVVDLQALPLNSIYQRGNSLEVGATVTLQTLLVYIEKSDNQLLKDLRKVVEHEATYNLRQVATVAGTLVSADGRSPLTTAFLALDAQISLKQKKKSEQNISLGDLLPLRKEQLQGKLIVQLSLPENLRLAYEYVARTPADWPLICAAVCQWPSGRTRLALGGFGESPLLAMDGPQPEGIEVAARDAFSHAGDQWASAEYRQEVAGILASRCIQTLAALTENKPSLDE
jgi:CO/xanthine dehydrogenase FAD-binding subunit